MGKDYSAISKQIINYILNKGKTNLLSEKQKKAIKNNIPEAIKSASKKDLIKNNRIRGKDNNVYKINYNSTSKLISFSGSQLQCKTIFKDISRTYDSAKTSKENMMEWIREVGVNKYVEHMLSYSKQDDFWLIFSKEIDSLEIYEFDNFTFEFEKFNTDLLIDNSKSTWIINWEGKPLFEVQIPMSKGRINTHNFRINKKYLVEFYKQVKANNETWGISVEVALCGINSLEVPSEYKGRYDTEMVAKAKAAISSYFDDEGMSMIELTECLANKREGQKKSPTDFMSNDKKVSVKTNFNNNTKVCPPEIGQPGLKQGMEHYSKITGIKIGKKHLLGKMTGFKKIFQDNIDKITQKQLEYLFSEDYIIYLRKMKSGKINTIVIDTTVKTYHFQKDKFSFSRDHKEWNESVSISYDGKNIAEMQMHSDRSPFKFRFNLKNILEVIKKLKGVNP